MIVFCAIFKYETLNVSFGFLILVLLNIKYTGIGDMPLFKVHCEWNSQKFRIGANSSADLKDKGTC